MTKEQNMTRNEKEEYENKSRINGELFKNAAHAVRIVNSYNQVYRDDANDWVQENYMYLACLRHQLCVRQTPNNHGQNVYDSNMCRLCVLHFN